MSRPKSRGSTAPVLTLAQFDASVFAVQQAVGDLDEGQHCGKAVRPQGRRPCASEGEAKNLYSQLDQLTDEAGIPPPPDPFAAAHGEWWDPTLRAHAKWNWWAWWKEWQRWVERARARLTAAEAGGASEGESGGRPAERLPAEGTKFSKEDAPAEFREGGRAGGAVLTATYLKDTPEWDLRGPYLCRNYGPGEALTTHIKVGRAKAYLFKEVAALRNIKTANEAKREETAKREERQ